MANAVSAKPVRRVACVLAMSVILAGCAGGGSGDGSPGPGEMFTPAQASRFVLHEGDLLSGYRNVRAESGRVECDSGYLANRGDLAESTGEAALKQQLLSLEPRACNLSTYEKKVGGATTGFQAMAVVFPDEDAASRSLGLFRKSFVEFSDLGNRDDLETPALGDEAVAGVRWRPAVPMSGEGLSSNAVHIWRLRNVAVILQSGLTLGMTEDDAVRIGRQLSLRAAAK